MPAAAAFFFQRYSLFAAFDTLYFSDAADALCR